MGRSGAEEDPEEEHELAVDMETINLDRDAEDVDLNHYRIGKIEGFGVLKKVKTLCLRQNLIKCIENLEELQSLRELDLYDNQIRKIENLESLAELEILDISFNLLRNIEGIDKLTRLKNSSWSTIKLIRLRTSAPCISCRCWSWAQTASGQLKISTH